MATKRDESQQPANTQLTQTRRSALKKMLVGTGVAVSAAVLPDKWAKPIVDKVLVRSMHKRLRQQPRQQPV